MTPEITPSRKEAQPSMLVRRVVAINHEGKILFLKRKTNKKTNAGKWELPGGKREQGQLMHNTMQEELLQEANLALALIAGFEDVVFPIEKNYPPDDPAFPNLHYCELVGVGRVRPGVLVLEPGGDHSNYRWHTLKGALKSRKYLTPEAQAALVGMFSLLEKCIEQVKAESDIPICPGGAILNTHAN